MEKGNLVNWETAEFELFNMTEKEVSMGTVCKPVKPGPVIMNKRPYESHIALCKKFHSKVSVVDSAEVERKLGAIYLNTSFCFNSFVEGKKRMH